MDVICPGCRKSYHETTEAFDADKSPRGNMVKLKDPWRKWGWCSFGDAGNGIPPKMAESPRTLWSAMDCPGCGAPMAPSGKLLVKGVDEKALRRSAPGSEYAMKTMEQKRKPGRQTSKSA